MRKPRKRIATTSTAPESGLQSHQRIRQHCRRLCTCSAKVQSSATQSFDITVCAKANPKLSDQITSDESVVAAHRTASTNFESGERSTGDRIVASVHTIRLDITMANTATPRRNIGSQNTCVRMSHSCSHESEIQRRAHAPAPDERVLEAILPARGALRALLPGDQVFELNRLLDRVPPLRLDAPQIPHQLCLLGEFVRTLSTRGKIRRFGDSEIQRKEYRETRSE